jgi:hypothetical protein
VVCWFRANDAESVETITDAVLALANFIQQFSVLNAHLHLVTEGATTGHPDETSVNSTVAAVWALGRSLQTEGAVPISGMTDLEPGTAIEVALLQVGADLACGAQETAWRAGRRFEHRLTLRPFRNLSERMIPTSKVDGYALGLAAHAGFEALRWLGREALKPRQGQIALAVDATGLNFRDILKVLDLYPLDRSEWRWLGDECAGRVATLGPGVEGFNVGDPVIAIAPGRLASPWRKARESR